MGGDFFDDGFFGVWLVCVVPALIEWLVYVGKPALLLPLARVPLGVERTFELPNEALVADSASPQQGYRRAAARALTPETMPWPEQIHTSSGIGGASGGSAWVRLTYQLFHKRPLALARISATADLEHLRLTSTWSPYPLSSFVIALPAMGFFFFRGGFPLEALLMMVLIFPVVIGINWIMARNELRRQVDEAMNQIEARFRDPRAWSR